MLGNKGVKICAGVAAICAVIALILVLTLPRPHPEVTSEQKRPELTISVESAIDAASREALAQEAAYSIVRKKEKEYNLGCLPTEYTKCATLVIRAENNPRLAGALRYAAAKKIMILVKDFGFAYGAGWVRIDLDADDDALIKFLMGE